MKNDLLRFLFVESAETDAAETELAENLEQLFEAADEAVCKDLEAKKTPLAKALGEFGISDADLQLDPEGFCIETDNANRYNDILKVLGTADATHKLAEMGWVVTKPGDDAMTNEQPHFRVRFLDLMTVETGDAEKPDEKIKAVVKNAREFATTEMDRDDDDLNPVDNEDGKMGRKATGVGKAKDGEDPDKAIHDALEAGDIDKLVEMTTTGSMGTLEQGTIGAGLIKKPKPYGKGTKFAMPGQWKVNQPVVNKQIKRHPATEALEPDVEAFLNEPLPSGAVLDNTPLSPELAQHLKHDCTCHRCNESFIYESQPEEKMGFVRCPHCTALVDQEGNVAGEGLGE